jgi:cathepsin E
MKLCFVLLNWDYVSLPQLY